MLVDVLLKRKYMMNIAVQKLAHAVFAVNLAITFTKRQVQLFFQKKVLRGIQRTWGSMPLV
ncbi:hypothetical protein FHS16_002843 [Paenibacillus endophyticus]|uniref:Uncharacterized protein n=1 Tax=Paenibacillus endophyticus TaxID=1294268 RepID=A0A7W5GAI1_9BACL|nr:hypothetical protein [Paenibacillus endophyticus]MBB3152786.1 hypothetical protein [Paenibacillus endophyticus]